MLLYALLLGVLGFAVMFGPPTMLLIHRENAGKPLRFEVLLIGAWLWIGALIGVPYGVYLLLH